MQMTYKVLCQLLTGSSYLEEVMLQKFHISNECLKNTSHNVVPSRITKCDYRDQPWMTVVIKNKLKEQSNLTKRYYKYGKRKFDLEKKVNCQNREV